VGRQVIDKRGRVKRFGFLPDFLDTDSDKLSMVTSDHSNPKESKAKEQNVRNAVTAIVEFAARHKWFILGAVVVIVFAWCVWPTLYRYDHLRTKYLTAPVRINRITGNAEVLNYRGWQTLASPSPTSSQE
jgi:hypothetical protein